MNNLVILLITCIMLFSCKKKQAAQNIDSIPFKASKLVIILIDGPRWEETWGDTTHQYQPYLSNYLKSEGCIFTNFYNLGSTLTNPGHCAVLTGNYENLTNNGTQLPSYPSIAQTFLQKSNKDSTTAQIITSKDKLEIFKTCTNTTWANTYTPLTDCGVNGLGTGYRHDTITYKKAIAVIQNYHPEFLFISFRDPDYSAHANNWSEYLNGIQRGDLYVYNIYNLLQSDPFYKDQTTFVVTNDHGRHPDSLGGFSSHGDNCYGCKHINLFIAGPDIQKNKIITTQAEQIDLHFTLSQIYGLNSSYSKGKFIKELCNP